MRVGDTFAGRYRIDGEVGAGGMGAVYAVTHLATKRKGALKVILGDRHDATAVRRFGREAELAGQLDTRHVVSVFDAGATPEGTPFLVMELLRGEDLSKLVARRGRLVEDLALRVASQCAAGLSRAHARGIVHRDIKTANVFLAAGEGDEIVVKILDFGIAKLRSDAGGPDAHSLTRTGSLLGSPLYMSPEQALGERSLDHRADLWSLGVTLYETLCGRTPFHDEESFGRLLMAICHTDAPPVERFASDLRPEVCDVVARLLRRDRDARFQSADELRASLLRLVGGRDGISASELVDAEVGPACAHPSNDGSFDETVPATPAAGVEGRSNDGLGPGGTTRDGARWRTRLSAPILAGVAVVTAGAGGLALSRSSSARRASPEREAPPVSAMSSLPTTSASTTRSAATDDSARAEVGMAPSPPGSTSVGTPAKRPPPTSPPLATVAPRLAAAAPRASAAPPASASPPPPPPAFSGTSRFE
ncbi:MAG: protein kinase [Polyangiaceae bacterium]|nr:protein kinase [Polyangiaceae bacterium]